MKKIVLVGTGMVGMSFAYASLNQNVCDELVLIDINKERAIGDFSIALCVFYRVNNLLYNIII